MDPSTWGHSTAFRLLYIRKEALFFFILTIILLLSGITGVATAEENATTSPDHGVMVVDARGVIDISQIGDIPLGEIPDERITVETTVANSEKKEISGLRIRSFLVRNGREDTISMQLGSDFRDVVLKPGELKTFKNNFVVSKQLKPGEYKIMIRIDSNVTAKEKNEDYTEFISSQIIRIGVYADSGGATPLYSPGKLETPGSYLVMRDIDGGSKDNVIRITCSGVTLDGGGHVISGTPTGYTSGVYVDGGVALKDIVIKNCVFEDVDFGVWLYRVEAATISNCIFRNCTNIGLRFDQTRLSSIVDNRFENNALGLGLFQSSGNSVTNNYFRNKFNVVANEEQKNTWNTEPSQGVNIIGGSTKAGNAWFDLNGSGFSVTTPDLNNDGIADAPYSINGMNIDYYPLSTGIITGSAAPEQQAPASDVIVEAAKPESPANTTEIQEPEDTTSQSPVHETQVSPEEPVGVQTLPQSPGVDLFIQDINTTTSTCLNTEFPITTTITNLGSLDAGAFSIHYYLSEDSGITTSDRDVGSLQVEGLMPMENKTYTGKITLPPSIPPKYYTIGVIIDPDNDVYENNKQNNARAFNQRIQVSDCQPE